MHLEQKTDDNHNKMVQFLTPIHIHHVKMNPMRLCSITMYMKLKKTGINIYWSNKNRLYNFLKSKYSVGGQFPFFEMDSE